MVEKGGDLKQIALQVFTEEELTKVNNKLTTSWVNYTSSIFSFQSKEVAEEFLSNFEPLLKQAEDLI